MPNEIVKASPRKIAKVAVKRGRPRKPIPAQIQKVILTLIATGDSDRAVGKITRVQPREWKQLAADDPDFASLLEIAQDTRRGTLAATLRQAMIRQIKAGHPWWAKLAIHNYNVGLKDPDVSSGAKLKKLAERAMVEVQREVQEHPQAEKVVRFRPINRPDTVTETAETQDASPAGSGV